MVIESLRDVLTQLVVLFAGVAAITGIVVLQKLFHNDLKELFDDENYFIFFFLVLGYSLYGLGEVSFYLMEVTLQSYQSIGISDIYWAAGGLLILFAYVSLLLYVLRLNKSPAKQIKLFMLSAVIVAVVAFFVFGVVAPMSQDLSFFNYFYPIISSLIVSAALSVLIFPKEVGDFATPLLIFFFASVAILVGDVLFTYTTAQGGYLTSSLGSLDDMFYLCGYGLSAVGFLTMRKSMHNLAGIE